MNGAATAKESGASEGGTVQDWNMMECRMAYLQSQMEEAQVRLLVGESCASRWWYACVQARVRACLHVTDAASEGCESLTTKYPRYGAGLPCSENSTAGGDREAR